MSCSLACKTVRPEKQDIQAKQLKINMSSWVPKTLDYPTINHIRAKVQSMITMHTRPRQTDRRTNIMAIARRFVLTNASRAKNNRFLCRMPLTSAAVNFACRCSRPAG